MNAIDGRVTFTSRCGHCGCAAPSHQYWQRDALERDLRRNTLQFVCSSCGRAWAPGPEEQANLIRLLFPNFDRF